MNCQNCRSQKCQRIGLYRCDQEIILCDRCIETYMHMEPFPGANQKGHFFACLEGTTVIEMTFTTSDLLEKFIRAVNTRIEWNFGLMTGSMFKTNEGNLEESLEQCRLEAWQQSEDRSDDNTLFTPKPEWIKQELKGLSKKKRRLTALLN